jgi:hypothetical protein
MARAAVLALAIAACGGSYRKVEPASAATITRAPTAGDAALAMLPAGPDVVIELDLARARANEVLGPIVDRWVGALDAGELALATAEAPGGPAGTPTRALAGASWVVLAAYDVGGDDATTVTLVAPGTGVEIPHAVKVADGVVALAPPPWIDKLAAVTVETSAAQDEELLALRARAMPTAADGAVFRLTARLSTDARIALAGAIGLEPAPRAISAWGDLADDAALVVDLDARDDGDPGAARRLRAALEKLIRRAADHQGVRALGLAPSIARTRIEGTKRGTWLRAIMLVPPGRVKWAAAELAKETTP